MSRETDDLKYSQKIAQEIADLVNQESATVLHLNKMIKEQEEETKLLIDRLGDKSRQTFMDGVIHSNHGDQGAQRLIASINRKKHDRRRKALIAISTSAAALVAVVILLTVKTKEVEMVEIATTAKDQPLLITKEGNYNLDSIDLIKNSIGYPIECTTKNELIYRASTITTTEYNEIIIPANYTYHVTLSDGTRVSLNAGSSLKYPIAFIDSTRTVELNGEAYFTVKKNIKPFIVKTNGLQVKVYGTSFNINSYCKNYVRTVLVEGSVGLSFDGMNQQMIVPNQMAVCNMETHKMTVEETYVKNHIGWVDGDFLYRNTPLSDIVEDIAQWYGVSFTSNTDLTTLGVSFYAKREKRLEEIIKLLEQVTDIQFIKEGGKAYSIEKK